MSWHAMLVKGDDLIDCTSIDENSPELAKELFIEFGTYRPEYTIEIEEEAA